MAELDTLLHTRIQTYQHSKAMALVLTALALSKPTPHLRLSRRTTETRAVPYCLPSHTCMTRRHPYGWFWHHDATRPLCPDAF